MFACLFHSFSCLLHCSRHRTHQKAWVSQTKKKVKDSEVKDCEVKAKQKVRSKADSEVKYKANSKVEVIHSRTSTSAKI